MTADLSLRLRTLTQDYHDGRLNLAAYRQMRGALLDSLVANVASATAAAAVAVTQPRGGSWRQADAVTRPGKPRVAPTGSEASTSSDAQRADAPAGARGETAGARDEAAAAPEVSRVPVRTIAIAVAVMAIAGIGFWLWHGHAASSSNSSGTTPVADQQDRIQTQLAQFTDRGDWSDASLTALNADLLELGGSRMAEASGNSWFQRFAEEVRQRLKEQQALASSPLTADNSPLAALAVTVGLDLNAPDAAIHIAALPPPHPVESAAAPVPRKASSVAAAAHENAERPEGAVQTEGASHATGGTSATTAERAVPGANAATAPGVAADDNAAMAGSASSTNARGAASATGTSRPFAAGTTPQVETHEGACRVELVGSRRPLCHDLLPAGAEGPALALIPPGAFDMGSPAAAEEQPVHRVTIREPFAISIYEVSQGEFKQFCEHAGRPCPAQPWSGDDYPVVNVSWDDARAYVSWLSNVTHHRYALPTEAQWEYAARAGRTGLFPNGDALSPTDAQYSMVAKQAEAARRSQKFNANAFRLMHTVGNVREWVEDAWAPSFAGASSDGSANAASQTAQRVARGGSYTDGATRLRLSMREGLPAATHDATTGFRIVRELP